MKKLFLGAACLVVLFALNFLLTSADHIDAPGVKSTSADITDFYAFASPANSDAMVFVTNIQGLTSPANSAGLTYDENVLTEINIDNDGDNVEDLVIQLIPRAGKMYAFGPYVPGTTGRTSSIDKNAPMMEVDITAYGESPVIASQGTMKLFAGPRDDPFFFDIGRFNEILMGQASGFADPGTDTFAGTNVLSTVIEVPKSSLGNADVINTWVVTKRKS
ncbi:MAG: DUF4331 family protein [Saprospiraceae bacterium]|nr:DUF4331 family protein [Saprospiraceae bacterium]